VDEHALQGWYPDPFDLHEQRYFSGGRPTKLVRDDRVEAYDEPPAQDVPGAYLGQQRSAIRDAARVGYPAAPHPGVAAPRRRTGLVNSLVALIAVGAVVAFVAIEGGFSAHHGPKSNGSAPAGTNLAAFVTRSARSTLAERSADFTVQGTIEVGGTEANLHGSGQVDFAADTVGMNVSTSVAGSTIVVTEIVTSQAIYQQLSVGRQSLSQILGGKHWFEIPLASGSSNSTLQGSLSSSLQVLEQQGARVTPMGPQDIGGRTPAASTR